MSFTPRTRAQIRDEFIAALSARYTAIGKELLVVIGSDAYMRADVLGLMQEPIEAQALDTTNQILPDKASGEFLDRHGVVEGLARQPATAARLTIESTGVPLAAFNYTGFVLIGTNGLQYTPQTLAGVYNGAGKATLDILCNEAGTQGTLSVGAVLTWNAVPLNTNPTVGVTVIVAAGTDAETDASYAERIIERRRERPASGNRADWNDWVIQTDAAVDAVDYPDYHDTLGANIPGAVSVRALGPPRSPQDSTTDTRVIGGTPDAILTAVEGYIEGTHNAAGVLNGAGAQQLRPVGIKQGNYRVRAIGSAAQNVTMNVTQAAAYAFPWTFDGAATVAGYVDGTKTLTLNAQPATLQNGMLIAVRVPTSGAGSRRGGFRIAKVVSGIPGVVLVLDRSVFDPVIGQAIRPEPPNGELIRTAVFSYFDALGPGDTSPASRFPTVETRLRAILYRPALAGDVTDVQGVLSCVITTPGGDIDPGAFTVLDLGVLTMTP